MRQNVPGEQSAQRDAPSSALAEKLGIKRVEVTAQRSVATMRLSGNTQPAGLLHGGATAALCEDVASAAANLHAADLGKVAVGTELMVCHLRPGRGPVCAEAVAVHLGRTRTVHQVTVTGEDGRTVSTAIATNLLVERQSPAT